MLWYNLKVGPHVYRDLPVYTEYAMPHHAVRRTRSVLLLDNVPFEIKQKIGEGAASVVHMIESQDGAQFAAKFYKDGARETAVFDNQLSDFKIMLPTCLVEGESTLIMPLGMDGVSYIRTFDPDEDVCGRIANAVYKLQKALIHTFQGVYTDVKWNNMVFFQSPDCVGDACVMFCDHGGYTPFKTTGVTTFPPPEVDSVEGSGYINIDGNQADACARYWSGLLLAVAFGLLDYRHIVWRNHPHAHHEPCLEQMLRNAQQSMKSPYDTWIDPDPSKRTSMSSPKRAKLDVRARNEGAEYLAATFPHPLDKCIEFRDKDAEGNDVHDYHWKGIHGDKYQLVTLSGTGAIKLACDPTDEFDGPAVIDRCFKKWVQAGPSGEYWNILSKFKDGSLTEEDAKTDIQRQWSQAGPLGTELHRQIELLLNLYANDWTTATYDPLDHENECTQDILTEFKQFCDWGRSLWVQQQGWEPYRTEYSIVWRALATDHAVCAGQIDGLMRRRCPDTNEWCYAIFDWKRVKPKYMLTEYERAFNKKCFVMFPHIPCTHFHKYSMQASLYSVMLYQTTGIRTTQLYVVRVHKELGEAQLVDLHNYHTEALYLLKVLESPDDVPSWSDFKADADTNASVFDIIPTDQV